MLNMVLKLLCLKMFVNYLERTIFQNMEKSYTLLAYFIVLYINEKCSIINIYRKFNTLSFGYTVDEKLLP